MVHGVVSVCALFLLLIWCVAGSQLQIRLKNGTSSWNGRLEISHNGTWTTVCSQDFGKQEAQVACKMLGFDSSRAMAVMWGQSGEGSGPILFGNITCTGKESSFDECQHDGIYKRDCNHSDDVGIICNIKPLRLRLTSVYGDRPDIHLTEIEIGTQWNNLCMTRNAAKVVCRQLGLSRHAGLIINASMLEESLFEQPKLEVKFLCLGNETSILECDHYAQNHDIFCGFPNSIICNESTPHLRILLNESSFPPFDGANLTLECESTQSGQSKIEYLWFEYSRKRIRRYYGKYLIFDNVTSDHHGLRVHCAANYKDNDLIYLVASETLILTVCCAPWINMHDQVLPSMYINDDKGYLRFEMTAYPIPHVTAMMYLGPVLTDGMKGEDKSNSTHPVCAATGLTRASVTCNITVLNISQAADGFYNIVFSNRLGQLPIIFTIRRHELNGEISSPVLLTFIGALAGGVAIVAAVTVFYVRRWKRNQHV